MAFARIDLSAGDTHRIDRQVGSQVQPAAGHTDRSDLAAAGKGHVALVHNDSAGAADGRAHVEAIGVGAS